MGKFQPPFTPSFHKGVLFKLTETKLNYHLSCYSGIILIRCLYYKPGQRLHDYKQVATHALGWVGYWVTAILHILNVFGCPTLYLVLAGQNMNEMLKNTVS
jgi:amino acid permease